MKLCKRGHENQDDADRCVVCRILLPGNTLGKPFEKGEGGDKYIKYTLGAKAWAKDAGVDWDSMQQAHKDYLIKAQRMDAPTAILDGSQVILGIYKSKPRASDASQAETVIVEITAESIESLNRSLRLLETLTREANKA